jgi:peptidoglycan/xylan/chitin deacetylase (PgdA/CDA1 family)
LAPRVAGAFGILMYHRVVVAPKGIVAPNWNLPPNRFRAQLSGLLERGYQPWPLRKVLACHRAGDAIPSKTFVVTFDDGYENVYQYAFPILKDLRVPATLFLATGYLDSRGPFPFDSWQGAGSSYVPADTWRPIATAQCETMLASGLVELGGHTHSHHDFRDRPDDLRRDLALSLDSLRTRFHLSESTFAFPYGYGCRWQDGPELADAAKDAGVLCALTTDSELVRPEDDRFNWGRFAALNSDSAASLAAKLDGTYSFVRHAWHRLRRRTQEKSGRWPEARTAVSSPRI